MRYQNILGGELMDNNQRQQEDRSYCHECEYKNKMYRYEDGSMVSCQKYGLIKLKQRCETFKLKHYTKTVFVIRETKKRVDILNWCDPMFRTLAGR